MGSLLARSWLLACHDGADTDKFPMTHEFRAMMLGVRRPGVTLALTALREHGVIMYNHGSMTMVDRQGLEAKSCSGFLGFRDVGRRKVSGRPLVKRSAAASAS